MEYGAATVTRHRQTVEMFQVLTAGLRASFRPLRALERHRGTCALQTTSFIGREAELAEVQEALKAHRLVTLTGVGGVGKTRLATEVAARHGRRVPRRRLVVRTGCGHRSGGGARRSAAVLGITQQPGKNVSEKRGRRAGGQDTVAGVRQLRARARRRRRHDRSRPGAVGVREGLGYQPRRAGGRRRASVAGALAGSRRGNRLRGGESVCRTRRNFSPRFSIAGPTRWQPWWRFVVASMGFRWPSSWRPRGWRR